MLKSSFLAAILLAATSGQALAATYVHGDESATAALILEPAASMDAALPMTTSVQSFEIASAPVERAPAKSVAFPTLSDEQQDSSLPEPQSWILMLVGLAVIGRAMRQKTKSFC